MKQELTVSEFEHIVTSIKDRTKLVYFHVKGEPLLHPELGTFLELCQHHQLKVNLTTNGTLLKDKVSLLVRKNALRQMNISLHSIEQNKQVIDVKKYFEGVFSLIEESKKTKSLIVSLRLWNNKTQVDPALNQQVLEVLSSYFAIPDLAEKIQLHKSIQLDERIYLNQDQEFVWPKDGTHLTHHGFCHGLRNQVAILVDGTVVPCCLDSEGEIKLGNIFDKSLEDILSSPRAQAIYDGFTNRQVVEPLCQKCSFRLRFNRKKSSE